MNLERFVSTRGASWNELRRLVDRAGTRPARLTAEELVALGDHYRAAAADLAVARQRFPHQLVTEDLETLVAKSRAVVYSRAHRTETVGRFLSTTMWREIRAMSGLLWLSIAVIVGSTMLGALWALTDPASAVGILPHGAHVSVHTRGGFYGISVPARGGLAAVIFVNNIVVAFLVVAGGFTFGFVTFGSLAYNGALLGVLGALEWKGGGFSQFARLVLPHGLLELSCFALAGAAGFSIARALIDPGTGTRSDALAAVTSRIGAALLGVVTFLVCAGLVEGIVTPWDLPIGAAVGLGVTLCAAFWTAVVVRGRKPSDVAADTSAQTRARAFSRA